MSDGDDRDGGKLGAFLLGFLVGVLVCLGAGGTFWAVHARSQEARLRELMVESMAQRERAEAARAVAEQALRDALKVADELSKPVEKGKK